jgi:tetrahydromethanopterin S-methyltransferase subunit G
MEERRLEIHGVEPRGHRMLTPGSLDSIEKIAAWIYEHDGRIDAWWEAQRDYNVRATETVNECQSIMRVKIDNIEHKIDAMQKTIYKATGAATAIGALMGVVVTIVVKMMNGS